MAHDPGGNLVCISCDSDDKGCIYFWNHENDLDYTLYSCQLIEQPYPHVSTTAKRVSTTIN
ncbi:SMI1/KNR4 family protein [Sphingobacterium micropteri]|uniref:hypothetical protein n=1 Tax=Sphingobacterium micropteri TaxID=2763501 RepID=UPI0037432ADB